MTRPKDWESWIDQQIREAQERGDFDDLPGKGKPLDLTPNPYAKDQELAFKILKDAGYAPEWIELDSAIRRRLERALAGLDRGWTWHQTRTAELADRSDRWAEAERQRSLADWQAAVAIFEEEVKAINQEITELNLKVPSPRFQRAKINAARIVKQQEQQAAFDMSDSDPGAEKSERMAETVRQVITRRERAPRSPRMERALKRLIWRYTRSERKVEGRTDATE